MDSRIMVLGYMPISCHFQSHTALLVTSCICEDGYSKVPFRTGFNGKTKKSMVNNFWTAL